MSASLDWREVAVATWAQRASIFNASLNFHKRPRVFLKFDENSVKMFSFFFFLIEWSIEIA